MNQTVLNTSGTTVRSFIEWLSVTHYIESNKFPHEIIWMIDGLLNKLTIEEVYNMYVSKLDLIKKEIQSHRFTSKHHELSHCLKLVFHN